jgi:hypothetical protein
LEGTLARTTGKWQREIRTRISQSEAQNSGSAQGGKLSHTCHDLRQIGGSRSG